MQQPELLQAESIVSVINDSLIPVQIDKEQIKAALQFDPEFFIQFFLGDEIDLPVPDFHPEIFWLMIHDALEVARFACAIPRDHAKTTLAKLACVWFFLFTDWRFIVYVSLTVGIAVPSVTDIIAFMESPNFKAVFGELNWGILPDGTKGIRQEGKGIYKFELNGKICILRAHGGGMQVRGINVDNVRPQLAILDDIEDEETNATPELFAKLKRWFYGPFRKALDKRKNKMIHIGNLTANQTLIAEHIKSPYWYSRVYGCLLANGRPLWEDFWTIEKLRLDYMEYLEAGMADVWFAEMMNMPTAGGRGIIKAEDIVYRPFRIPDDIKYGFITIDLAISEQTWAHKTVIAVHGFVDDVDDLVDGQWQCVDYEGFSGIDPINLFWAVVTLCKKWRISTVGIESTAYQASLKSVFEYLCIQNGITNMEFVQLQAIGRKAIRIISWAAWLKDGTYALNQGDFVITQELLTYRPDKKDNADDHIDAFAYAPQMIQNWMHLIMREFKVVQNQQIQGSYEVCDA